MTGIFSPTWSLADVILGTEGGPSIQVGLFIALHAHLQVRIIQSPPRASGAAQQLPLTLYFAKGRGFFSSEISPVWKKVT